MLKKIERDLTRLNEKVDRLEKRHAADEGETVELEVGIRTFWAELYARFKYSATAATSASDKHATLGHLVLFLTVTFILSRF